MSKRNFNKDTTNTESLKLMKDCNHDKDIKQDNHFNGVFSKVCNGGNNVEGYVGFSNLPNQV